MTDRLVRGGWLVLALGCLGGTAQAATVFVSNGYQARSFVRDCRSSPGLTSPDKCIEGNGASFTGTFREGYSVQYPGATTASSTTTSSLARTSSTNVTGGSIQASGGNPPTVRLAAFTGTNCARVSTGVTSVQGWSWDGSGDANRSLALALTFSGTYVNEFGAQALNPGSVLGGTPPGGLLPRYADLRTSRSAMDPLWLGDPVSNPDGPCVIGNSLTSCLASKRADYLSVGTVQFGSDSPNASLSFAMEAGRSYFTYLSSTAFARFGAHLDARNTILTRWNDQTGLTAAPGMTVPEPGTLALLGLGLAGLGWSRSRRPV